MSIAVVTSNSDTTLVRVADMGSLSRHARSLCLGFAITFSAAGLYACRADPLPRYKRAPMRGVVLAHVHNSTSGYGSGASHRLYPHWRKLGANTVQLNTFAYQPSIKAPKLSWSDPSLQRQAVLREIRHAHAQGFAVMLKPHIWPGGTSSGAWRNQIDFKDKKQLNEWFKNYRAYLSEQLEIAREGRVEIFVIGTELVLLSRHESRWRELIAWARKRFDGKLTYACEAWNAKHIRFWDELDFIGLDFYYGFSRKTRRGPDDTPAAYFARKLDEHRAHASQLGREIILTELGFPAHRNAIREPHAWPDARTPASDSLQAYGYRQMRLALGKAGYPYGVFLWKYVTSLNSYERSAYPKGFILQGKPAEREAGRLLRGIDDE